MINLREQYWAVEVPEDANGFEFSIQDDGVPCFSYWYKANLDTTVVCLPPGTWSIVCTIKEVTCDHAHEIVERDGEGFKDYSQGFHHDIPFPDPVQSFETLLTSKGCDKDKNYLIIKKL